MLRNVWNYLAPCLYRPPDGGGSGGGGGGSGDPPSGNAPQQTGDVTGAGDKTKPKDGRVEFTEEQQAKIDEIVVERLERAKSKWESEQEEAQKKAEAEAEQKRLEEQAEWQKLAERRAEETATAQAEAQRLSEEMASVRIRHAVEILAAEMGFQSPGDAFGLADLAGVKISEDGEVRGVKEALEKLVKDKPYLLKKAHGGIGTPRPTSQRTAPGGQEQPAPGHTVRL